MQGVVAAVLLVALATYVLATGPHIAHTYAIAPRCNPGCAAGGLTNVLSNLTRFVPEMNDVVTLAPVLIGMFWGAPMVAREIETGSIRLVLMQSVSRSRCLSTILLVVGIGSAVAGGLTSVMVTWWASPWDRYHDMPFGTFDVRDIVPIGCCMFAVALGALMGAMLRRTIPAMALTLLAYGVVIGAIGQWLRPHLLGDEMTSQYWPLQWTETSIYVVLAIALAGATIWWVRRRLT